MLRDLVDRPVERVAVPADGWRKPLTLRTNWSAASRTSSGGATSEPSRRRLMLLHMQPRYRDGRLNDG
jgi:hypothetical protein